MNRFDWDMKCAQNYQQSAQHFNVLANIWAAGMLVILNTFPSWGCISMAICSAVFFFMSHRELKKFDKATKEILDRLDTDLTSFSTEEGGQHARTRH